MADLKVGGIHAYRNYEVEETRPYPDIDPHQNAEKVPVQPYPENDHRDDTRRRRFRAMRQLIDALSKHQRIVRVDYPTAETELGDIGRDVAEDQLLELLLSFKIPLNELESIIKNMRSQLDRPLLRTTTALSETINFLPVFVPGLLAGFLSFQRIPLAPLKNNRQVMESLDLEEFYSYFVNRVGLEIFRLKDWPETDFLNINLLVAVSEVDEDGRRVLLYKRPGQEDYALYADKAIDLSI